MCRRPCCFPALPPDYPALLLGVNLGGLGTLIASMASLISYKLYAAADGARTGKYMLFFTAVNVVAAGGSVGSDGYNI